MGDITQLAVGFPPDFFEADSGTTVADGATQNCTNQFGQAAMTPQQVQPANVTNAPAANVDAKPSGIHSEATVLDKIEQVGHSVQVERTPPQNDSIISGGFGAACSAMSMKVDAPEISRIVAQGPANNPEVAQVGVNANQAVDAQAQALPENTIHTQRANFDLANNSGPSMGGMG